jgi:predicted PurR-regulated permease PerM
MAQSPDPPAVQNRPRDPGSERRWLRTDVILLTAALGVLLWVTAEVWLLVFAGILLAVGLDGLSQGVAGRTPLSRGWALALVLVLIVAALGLLGMAVAPQFLSQLDELWQLLGGLADEGLQRLRQYGWAQPLLGGAQEMGDAMGEVAGHVTTATLGVLGALASLIILVAITLFAVADPPLYRRGLLTLVPPARRARIDETLSAIGHALRWWFLGQLVSMLLLGTTVAVGLWVIGVELWLGLGLLTALLTFIPFLGPIIAGIPIVLVAFVQGTQIGLMVLVFYLVVQTVEGHFLTPLIQQRAVSLPPVLLIGVQILMGTLFGIVGLILAAPLTVVGMVGVKYLYVEDVLGQERAGP